MLKKRHSHRQCLVPDDKGSRVSGQFGKFAATIGRLAPSRKTST